MKMLKKVLKGSKGFTTAEYVVIAMVVGAVAITASSSLGGSMLRLTGRDKLIIDCQVPSYYAAHQAECDNP